MFRLIYIEKSLVKNQRTREILDRFPQAEHIICERYNEVFNRRKQNFRFQKQQPALIIAEKLGKIVIPTPEGYGIGGENNYYFSHMLNCIYDCRYCFLQGMYQSANIVLFINYEDFSAQIEEKITSANKSPHFFSGYDCDSLALDPISGFSDHFLNFFEKHSDAIIELRTKSVQIRSLLKRTALPNCVVAFSLNPQCVSTELEKGTPNLSQRMRVITKLSSNGWPIGLRFDPLIYHKDWKAQYSSLFHYVFNNVSLSSIHSVSLGQFRLPTKMFKRIQTLYPEEPILSWGLTQQNGQVSYQEKWASEMHEFCLKSLESYVPSDIIFPCPSITTEKIAI
ncbi:MAG: DNA photolyase [Candidatus Latescibacterota bacterium]|nr:DNA photolyase [Candidatus Latescibacterota bacterium]